jgi:hypothetical protein
MQPVTEDAAAVWRLGAIAEKLRYNRNALGLVTGMKAAVAARGATSPPPRSDPLRRKMSACALMSLCVVSRIRAAGRISHRARRLTLCYPKIRLKLLFYNHFSELKFPPLSTN